MAAMPVSKSGCCWRVGDGSFIRVNSDKQIPNHPTNRILYLVDEEWWVAELIDLDLNWWNRDFIMSRFQREDLEAICRTPLSHRHVSDSIIWLYNKDGLYSVKSRYQVATQMTKEDG